MCPFIQNVSKQLHADYTVLEEASLVILDALAIFKENILQNHSEFTLMDLGLLQGLVPGHRVVEEKWKFKVSVLCSCVISAFAGAVHTGSRHFSSLSETVISLPTEYKLGQEQVDTQRNPVQVRGSWRMSNICLGPR